MINLVPVTNDITRNISVFRMLRVAVNLSLAQDFWCLCFIPYDKKLLKNATDDRVPLYELIDDVV